MRILRAKNMNMDPMAAFIPVWKAKWGDGGVMAGLTENGNHATRLEDETSTRLAASSLADYWRMLADGADGTLTASVLRRCASDLDQLIGLQIPQ